MYLTFLASAFRSIRFGTNEARKGVALQLDIEPRFTAAEQLLSGEAR